jgi:hypothetical protein
MGKPASPSSLYSRRSELPGDVTKTGTRSVKWLRNCRAEMEELKSSRRRGAGGKAGGGSWGRWFGMA